jgi:hypothetical protein
VDDNDSGTFGRDGNDDILVVGVDTAALGVIFVVITTVDVVVADGTVLSPDAAIVVSTNGHF